ncbi:hypothetical protein [Cereibacter sphaeroides]|uniref:hypothetical protein n=1 Tax=Cereibacter sphaeroides TaxID=1063 RepID=UPI001F345C21|nr:hypothetical protein [Cereibacter sphaeroides]
MTWREPYLLANLPKRIFTSRSSLGLDQGSQTWTFAKHFGQAEAIPRSRAAAKDSMNRPAMGSDRCRPIDRLASIVDDETAAGNLTRIE